MPWRYPGLSGWLSPTALPGQGWVPVLLWNVYHPQGGSHPNDTKGQMLPWAPNPVFNSLPFLLATFMIIIFHRQLHAGTSRPGPPERRWKLCRSDGRPQGLSTGTRATRVYVRKQIPQPLPGNWAEGAREWRRECHKGAPCPTPQCSGGAPTSLAGWKCK